MKFSDLAERQILKAQAEEQYDNLKGTEALEDGF